MRASLVLTLCWMILVLSLQPALAEGKAQPLPAWINKIIAERKAGKSRDVIEESRFDGKRAYLFTSGLRADTGDEHVLYSEDGKELCKFGGFVGIVTSGACEIEKITYVRTIYGGNSR